METVMSSYLPTPVLIAVVCSILGSELLKKLDRKDLFKSYKVIFPMTLSALMSALLVIGGFLPREQCWFWTAVIFMLSVSSYEMVIKRFLYHEKDMGNN